jgi:hypothetical protein
MIPQQRPDPKVIQKVIEVTTARKDALIGLVEAVSALHLALDPEAEATTNDLKRHCQTVCAAYCALQNLEIVGATAYLNDLETVLKQAESPILQAHIQPRGRG